MLSVSARGVLNFKWSLWTFFILFLTYEEKTECASKRNYWSIVPISYPWLILNTIHALGTNNKKVFRHIPGFSGASLASCLFQD